MTAEAARAGAAEASAQALLSSIYTGRCDSETMVRAIAIKTARAVTAGIPRGSLAHDKSGFNWFVRFGQQHMLRWWPPSARDATDADAAAYEHFVASGMFWIGEHMPASARRKARGYESGEPNSCLSAVYGYLRVLRDCSRLVPNIKRTARVLKGMIQLYMAEHGQFSLETQHHIPFALGELLQMVQALDAREVKGLSATEADTASTMLKFGLARAPRIDEIVTEGSTVSGGTCWKRGSFAWTRDGVLVGSTEELDATGGPGLGKVLLQATNPPSKTDRSGKKWAGKKMWYAYTDGPLNFASAWYRYEKRHPCPAGARRMWPAFSPTGNDATFSYDTATATLKRVFRHIGGDEYAAAHSYHDFRATVASAVIGADKKPALAQALVCWATEESVALYGQMLPHKMAEAVELVATVDAKRHADKPRPHTGPESVIAIAAAAAAAAEAPPTAAGAAETAVPSGASSSGLTATAVVDLGDELGETTVDTSHALAGMTVLVPMAAWGAGAGNARCKIIGHAADTALEGSASRGVFAVYAQRDKRHWALTKEVLRPCLSAARQLLM